MRLPTSLSRPCQSSSGWFVDDTFYFQTCDTASIFGCLTLSIVKVGRNGDNSFSYRLTRVIFSSFLHFFSTSAEICGGAVLVLFSHQGFPCIAVICRDDFVRHDGNVTLNFFVPEAAADQAFNRKQGIFAGLSLF